MAPSFINLSCTWIRFFFLFSSTSNTFGWVWFKRFIKWLRQVDVADLKIGQKATFSAFSQYMWFAFNVLHFPWKQVEVQTSYTRFDLALILFKNSCCYLRARLTLRYRSCLMIVIILLLIFTGSNKILKIFSKNRNTREFLKKINTRSKRVFVGSAVGGVASGKLGGLVSSKIYNKNMETKCPFCQIHKNLWRRVRLKQMSIYI